MQQNPNNDFDMVFNDMDNPVVCAFRKAGARISDRTVELLTKKDYDFAQLTSIAGGCIWFSALAFVTGYMQSSFRLQVLSRHYHETVWAALFFILILHQLYTLYFRNGETIKDKALRSLSFFHGVFAWAQVSYLMLSDGFSMMGCFVALLGVCNTWGLWRLCMEMNTLRQDALNKQLQTEADKIAQFMGQVEHKPA